MHRNDVVGIFLSDVFRFSESSDHLCSSLLIDFEPLTDLLVRGVLVEGDMVNKHIHIPVRNAVNLNGIKRCEIVHTHRKRRHILLLRRKALIVRLVHIIVEPELVLIIVKLDVVLVVAVLLTETLVDLAIALTDLIGKISDACHSTESHDTLDDLLYIHFDYLHLVHYGIAVVDFLD